jgi:DNA-binding beta-propeller fold protein YncE
MWLAVFTALSIQSGAVQHGGVPMAATAQLQFPYDDLADRCVHWDVHLIQPLTFSSDGAKLYALNQPGCRLVVFDPATVSPTAEIPIGPGAVAIAERPGTHELWVTDCVTSVVTVIDLAVPGITHSIRVGAEPYGIAFTPSGDRAYVACSAARTVAVVSTGAYQVVQEIPIPAREPRGLVYGFGRAWVIPLISGNDSAPMGAGTGGGQVERIVSIESLAGSGGTQLPDRDLLAIATQPDPANDALAPADTRTGLGTVLLNVHARPGTSELWIPNTEALNTQTKGEASFVAGQVVSNRITIVDTSGAVPATVVDLDALAPATAKCAQPTGIAFDPVRPRAYVCGYGSDLVAVLDLSGGSPAWAGSIALPYKQFYPRFTGPRTCCVDAAGQYLYVLNKGDNSLSRVDLAALPASQPFTATAPSPTTLGFEPTSGEERMGRNHFINARNSKSLTSSCASCHVDGRTDGLVWNLSLFLDPEATPKGSLAFPIDDKGPLVTQNTQRQAESGPYHWRGEKEKLVDFNPSFVDLLERTVGGVKKNLGPDFRYLEHYIKRLAYHANPLEEFERVFTPLQAKGAHLFMTKPVFQGLACVGCHQLPFGTSGEVTKSHIPGQFAYADVAQLRGLAEKYSPPLPIGGAFGTRTELGAGYSHGGAYPSLQALLLGPDPDQPSQQAFPLTPAEADALAAFLLAFDSGLAPATACQFTVDANTAGSTAPKELARLLRQARKGDCDVIARLGPTLVQGTKVWPSLSYDPELDLFLWPSLSLPACSPQALLSMAESTTPVTFFGVPRLMGRSMAIDRDMDRALDFDELALGTNPEQLDTDDDGFPDGYETKWGLDPLVADTTSPDTQPPAVIATRLVGATTNTIKFQFRTDEVAFVLVSYNGGIPVARLPLQNDFDDEFSATINELQPATAYAFDLELRDPAGNVSNAAFHALTRPRIFGDPVFVQDVSSTVVNVAGSDVLQNVVTLRTGQIAPAAGYDVETALLWIDPSGAVSTLMASSHALSDASGMVAVDLPLPTGLAHPGTLWFVVRSIQEPTNEPAWRTSLDVRTWRATSW